MVEEKAYLVLQNIYFEVDIVKNQHQNDLTLSMVSPIYTTFHSYFFNQRKLLYASSLNMRVSKVGVCGWGRGRSVLWIGGVYGGGGVGVGWGSGDGSMWVVKGMGRTVDVGVYGVMGFWIGTGSGLSVDMGYRGWGCVDREGVGPSVDMGESKVRCIGGVWLWKVWVSFR